MAADRTSRGGFTLVEVIVSVMIMGLMLSAIARVLTTVRDTRDLIHNIQEEQITGPAILDQIERDLRAVFLTGLPRDMHLRVENHVILGEDADRIDFLCSNDSLLWTADGDRNLRADVNEVGFCLRSSPENDDFRELYRREDFGIDEEPFQGGQYIFLNDRIVSLDIAVYAEDGPDAEPLEEWGVNANDPETTGLPASLRFRLVIEIEPRLLYETQGRMLTRQKRTFERIVRFPESLRPEADQIPRLAVPALPSAGGGDETLTGGPGGSGSDEEGGGAGGASGGAGGGGGRGGGGGGGSDTIDGEVIGG